MSAEIMQQGYEYTFTKKSIAMDVILTAVFVPVLLFVTVCLALKALPLIVFAVLPITFIYLQYNVIKIVLQYNKYDDGKTIIISADILSLMLVQNGNTITVNSTEVERVEVYEQTAFGSFGSYYYMVIYTTNEKKLLITKLTVPLTIYDKAMEKFLRKKPRAYFKKTFNYIDEDKFPL